MGKGKGRICGRIGMLLVCSAMIMLGGCSKEALSTKLLNESPEISEGYEKYQELQEEGRITAEGNLKLEQEPEVQQPTEREDIPEGVKVTFANNSLLEIFYYSDAELTKRIDTESCYLEPNACIYASVPVGKSEYSNMYSFSGFRIYEYDTEERKTLKETVALGADKMVYQIPMMTEGYGISIVPVGEYSDRAIVMNDYVINEAGEKVELSGAWTLNNKEYYHEEVAISPLTSYVVSYAYDKDVYYFVSATPESACHYPRETGNTDGEVIFKNQEPGNAVESFSVELHKYLSASIDNKAKGLVSVNVKDTGESESIRVTEKVEMNNLKCGAVIEVKTDKVHKLDSTQYDLAEPTEVADGYLYTFIVPEVAEAKINFTVYSWDKKTIDITVDKASVTNWLDNLFGGGKEKESILMIRSGETVYTYEDLQKGKEVVLNEYEDLELSVSRKIPEGSQVHIVIDNKETFIVKPNSTEFRKVLDYDDVSSLRITIQNIENENVEQKTKLEVTLDESLGSNILFSVNASGKNIVKEVGYLKNKETIYNGDIDAEQNIVITARNIQLYPNTAVKINIEKDDSREIRYCQGSNISETISTLNKESYSGEITITISLVDVATYKEHTSQNYSVTLNFADTDGHVLKNSEVLEENRDVYVTITADDGYYIAHDFTGGFYMEGDTVYKRKMEYSDYVKKIDEIIEDNPVKKLIKVTLDGTTPYQAGTVTFEIGGESKPAGTYYLKERETIKFTFKVAEDSEYGIVNDNKLTAIVNKYLEKKSETITISTETEGTVIRVKDYMTVEKKED